MAEDQDDGEGLERVRDGFRVRIRYGKDLRKRFLIRQHDESAARARAVKLRSLASMLSDAGRSLEAPIILRKAAAVVTERDFVEVVKVAEGLCGHRAVPDEKAIEEAGLTFRAVGERWTSGWFHQAFPDRVGAIIQDTNIQRLEKAIYPHIGHKLIRLVTRADCDDVMRRLPPPKGRDEMDRETRRQYAGLMNRILNLAELAGYIERNPLPRGWLPKPGPKKRFPILYPSEDAALLRCQKVWVGYRLFYGFLHREGMRRSEAAQLQLSDIDLDHEVVTLDENKTNHPRWWRLSPGVADALRAWRDLRNAEDNQLVFIEENGGAFELNHLADAVRTHLADAEITRADLTSVGPLKRRFGTHSFRRSFVTRSLALGKNEDWVRQRTGHKSDELLTYRQTARSLVELELGDVGPLLDSIPDLLDPPLGWATGGPKMVGAAGFEPATPRPPV